MGRMEDLVNLLNKYAYEYYTLDAPTISDKEYDALYDELILLEQMSGNVLKDSPTNRVGGEISEKFYSYTHKKRLYSLDKAQSKEKLKEYLIKLEKKFNQTPSLTIENKYDGITISLTYKNGSLEVGATRGDGRIGEDVTNQIRTIKTIPYHISFKGEIEIIGEGLMRYTAFEKYNKEASIPLKNPRNGVAGAIRNLDPKLTAKRNLDFIAYNINYCSEDIFSSQKDMNDFLKLNGFLTDESFKVVNNYEETIRELEKIEEGRAGLDFMIDGAVIKVNDLSLREILGETEKFPRWAIAYKFLAEETTTILKDVVWRVSRTGKLNPLAILEPVELMGVTVKRATLNNYADILKKDIKIGSRVFIRRSNDVIPEIMGVAEHFPYSKQVEKPVSCPSCNSGVKEEGVFLYCSNENCAPKIISSLIHFAAKACMNIEGLSDKTAELLFNELKVSSFYDLYDLKKEDLLTLEGFKDKKANNLIESIEKSKQTTLDRFVFALGIPNIGKKASMVLAEKFYNIDNLINAEKDDFIALEDFGEIMAHDIYNFFRDEKNIFTINKLFEKGVTIEFKQKSQGVLQDKIIVLTGSLPTLKRGDAAQLIINNGGEVADSISKRVNLVLAGENAGSKLDKAKLLGIKIISEKDFLAMINK